MPLRKAVAYALVASACLLPGCGGYGRLPAGMARGEVTAWAEEAGFRAETVVAAPFRLLVLLRRPHPADTLVVYIEGDGAAWPTVYRPPRDPTPLAPYALQLAMQDEAPAVAYLARPCQYPEAGQESACDSRYWSGQRYSAPVLAAMNAAIDHLKHRSGAHRLGLVGYSGGGVVASLLATQRQDVVELITVASPLALGEWAARQGLSPLAGSIDPLTQASLPDGLAATHYAGRRDDVVPPVVVERYAAARGGRLSVLDEFDHDCCWQRDWVKLLAAARGGRAAP